MSARNRYIREKRREARLRGETFGLPLRTRSGPTPDVEVLPWAFHPDRLGVEFAPKWFTDKLVTIHPDLRCTWHPLHERWLIWIKKPENRNEVCPGWSLLLYWEHAVTKTYLPLSDLVFANLAIRDREKYRNGIEYFDKLTAQAAREKASRAQTIEDDRKAFERDFYNSKQISSAGDGSRSALADTIVPSRGEAAWRQSRRQWTTPPEILKAEKDDKEKAFYGR